MDAKPTNMQLFKNKYEMPNIYDILDGVSQIVTKQQEEGVYFLALNMKYANNQL